MTGAIQLERCSGGDPRYVAIRNRHYVRNNGTVGRALHYLVVVDGTVSGIISGGSAAFAGKARDRFFGLDLAKQFDEYFADEHENEKSMRDRMLGTVINNLVFRLEYKAKNADERNLAPMVLARWRRQIIEDWEEKYGDPVLGFETFVVQNEHRSGKCYVADNWTEIGRTTTGKLIYCKKNAAFPRLYTGRECLLPYDVVGLLEAMYKAGTGAVEQAA